MARQVLFYDIEVFAKDFMVVIVENDHHFVMTRQKDLLDFWNNHKNDIYVGYNNTKYDQYIFKAILLGLDPKRINDRIILGKEQGWEILQDYYKELRRLGLNNMINYDVMVQDEGGLKTLEAYMGDDIFETEVDFNLNRKLTRQEQQLTYKYCLNDVLATRKVFMKRIDEFKASMDLCRTFGLKIQDIGKTRTRIAQKIIDCTREDRTDEFDYLSLVPFETIRLGEYDKPIKDWLFGLKNNAAWKFKFDPSDVLPDESVEQAHLRQFGKIFYKQKLNLEVHGVNHTLGFGGLHSQNVQSLISQGRILHLDLASMYPTIMTHFDLFTRNSNDIEKFTDIYHKRLDFKKAGDKKNADIYKIVINSVYGLLKDRYSTAYDPAIANAITTTGQLLTIDYINTLEENGIDFELIQSNTDGLIIQIDDNQQVEDKLVEITKSWEKRTGLSFGIDHIDRIYQRDVNNYLFVGTEGEIERKGGDLKEGNELDANCPIIRNALAEFLAHGTPIEETINNAKNLMDFQTVFKLKGSFHEAWHNGQRFTNKVYRVFASTDERDGCLGRKKPDSPTIYKFADCPEHCFLENGNIQGMEIPKTLDRQWYIDKAIEKAEAYGFEFENSKSKNKNTKIVKSIVRTNVETGEKEVYLTKKAAGESIGKSGSTVSKYIDSGVPYMGYEWTEEKTKIKKNETVFPRFSEIGKEILQVDGYKDKTGEKGMER